MSAECVSAGLASEQRGTGHPVVLLHGWALNLTVWRDCARALEQRYRVISLDLPGHGRSTWGQELESFDRQVELLDRSLPGERVSLLGWSLGGLFAMALAARRPERIAKLVLVATSPRFVTGPDWQFGLSLLTVRKFASQLKANYRQTVNDFLELQTRGSVQAGPVLAELRSALDERGDAAPGALRAGLSILEQSDLRAEAASISAPVLLVSGQYDRITPPAAMKALQALLRDARRVEIGRAGHAPFLSHSELFQREVGMFLDDRDQSGEHE